VKFMVSDNVTLLTMIIATSHPASVSYQIKIYVCNIYEVT